MENSGLTNEYLRHARVTRWAVVWLQLTLINQRTPNRMQSDDIPLVLICPDRRMASLVLRVSDAAVVFANSACIRWLRTGDVIAIAGDRLTFVEPDLDREFQGTLANLVTSDAEIAYLPWSSRTSLAWLGVTIRNYQGFYRDAVESKRLGADASQLVVVDFVTGHDRPDRRAIVCFARRAALSVAETELLQLTIDGWSLQEAARKQAASLSVMRQRMRSILSKTARRQPSELVALVMSLFPA